MTIGHKQAALGAALWCYAAQGAVEILAAALARQGLGEGAANLKHLLGALVHKLKAIVADACFEPAIDMAASLLGLCAKHGIAATNIGHYGVGAAIAVAQCHAMLLAGVTTILKTGAIGEEAAEHTVLGVEHGQVLVCDYLKCLGAKLLA